LLGAVLALRLRPDCPFVEGATTEAAPVTR
jgi:hypothetical protein